MDGGFRLRGEDFWRLGVLLRLSAGVVKRLPGVDVVLVKEDDKDVDVGEVTDEGELVEGVDDEDEVEECEVDEASDEDAWLECVEVKVEERAGLLRLPLLLEG